MRGTLTKSELYKSYWEALKYLESNKWVKKSGNRWVHHGSKMWIDGQNRVVTQYG